MPRLVLVTEQIVCTSISWKCGLKNIPPAIFVFLSNEESPMLSKTNGRNSNQPPVDMLHDYTHDYTQTPSQKTSNPETEAKGVSGMG
jgi:hypothetical protein